MFFKESLRDLHIESNEELFSDKFESFIRLVDIDGFKFLWAKYRVEQVHELGKRWLVEVVNIAHCLKSEEDLTRHQREGPVNI